MATAKKAAPADDVVVEEPVYEVQGPDKWGVDEHVRHAQSLYGQPPWLVKAVMKGHVDPDGYTKEFVQSKVDAFNAHPVYGEGGK